MREAVRARLKPAVSYRFLWGFFFHDVASTEIYTTLLEQQLGLDETGDPWPAGAVREA